MISLLFIDVPHIIPFRLILTLWPIGHIALFALIAGAILVFHPTLKKASFSQQFIKLTISAFALGICFELIQPFFSRTAQLDDIFFNYIGTLATLLFFGNLPLPKKRKILVQFLYAVFLVNLLRPSFLTAYDEWRQRNDFPVIANYYNETALTRWKAHGSLTLLEATDSAITQSNLLQATFKAQKASRVVLRYFQEDWQSAYSQGLQRLQLRFYNPSENTLPLNVIITDKHYDKSNSDGNYRFAVPLTLVPGWSTHHVKLSEIEQKPVARNIDLTKMAGIDFYMYKLKAPITLFIDEVKLVK